MPRPTYQIRRRRPLSKSDGSASMTNDGAALGEAFVAGVDLGMDRWGITNTESVVFRY